MKLLFSCGSAGILAAAFLIFGALAAQCQDKDKVIPAANLERSELDVPISLQAFSRAEIKASGIDDLQTLKDRAGLQFPPQNLDLRRVAIGRRLNASKNIRQSGRSQNP